MNISNNNLFVFFGCWNESFCNPDNPSFSGSSQVIYHLLNNTLCPKFYIIAGDNYYPIKDKENQEKEYSDINFESGFECLDKLKNKSNCYSTSDIYLLLGNHDLQYENGLLDKNTKLPLDKCHILTEELKYRDKFHFNKRHIELDNSLILFTISTLYTDALEATDKHKEENDCINKLEYTFSDQPWSHKSLKEIIKFEENLLTIITQDLIEKKIYKNIIICGHDPIVSRRNKFKKKGKEIKETKIKETLNTDGLSFLNKIYSLFPESNKFYLCADVHQFQKCEIILGDNTINQYVVGTGGTTCDEDCVSTSDSIIDEIEWKKLKGKDTLLKSFKIEECLRSHGYLVGNEDTQGNFIPYFQKSGECIDNKKKLQELKKSEQNFLKSTHIRTYRYSGGKNKKKKMKTKKKLKKLKK